MVKVAVIGIKSCDDCVYSDLDGLNAVCKLSSCVNHGGEFISSDCPLPDSENFVSLATGFYNFDYLEK